MNEENENQVNLNEENNETNNEEKNIDNEENTNKENNVTKQSFIKTAFSGMGKIEVGRRNLFIVLIIFAVLILMIILSSTGSTGSKEEKKTENKKKEESITESVLKTLKEIDIFEYEGSSNYGYFYKNDLTDLNTITSKQKIEIALYDLTKNLDVKHPINLTKEEVENKIIELFPNTNYVDESASVRCMNFTYSDGVYKGVPSNCVKETDLLVSKVIDVKEEKETVSIYQKIGVLTTNKDKKIDLYTSLKKEKNDYVETLNIRNYDEFMIEKYTDRLYTYIFTFKKGDNKTYLFEKVEKVADCIIAKTC